MKNDFGINIIIRNVSCEWHVWVERDDCVEGQPDPDGVSLGLALVSQDYKIARQIAERLAWSYINHGYIVGIYKQN